MLLSGFTIVRNGVQFDYPFIESIKSILPVVDEFIINVGFSDDDTLAKVKELISSLAPDDQKKFVVFESQWPLNDPEKRKGGRILADQTNAALERCQGKWCFYLQADEVVHEEDLNLIRDLAIKYEKQTAIEGFIFEYIHFYAVYGVVQTSRSAYRREVRIIRNALGIESTGDAQSFRHRDGRKLSALLTKARIFHYGWVKPQETMKKKTGFMDTLYHPGANAEAPATGENYLFKRFIGLKPFQGRHPQVMQSRISTAPHFDFFSLPKVFEIGDLWKWISGGIERVTGIRPFEYKNYRIVKK